MSDNLKAFFCPKSVAVIGASRTKEKVGSIVLRNILESKFKGKVYPVNPTAKKIQKLTCYKDISSLPEVPDLAVLAVPANLTNELLIKLGEKGVKNVIVFAAGYKETGEEGEKLEKELIGTSEKYQLNLLGPNCLGFVNNFCPINATFAQPVNAKGNVRFISQSGAIAASVFDWSQATGLGYSDFVTLGNKAVLNETDILNYFDSQKELKLPAKDKETLSNVWPVGMYLESITNGEEFLKITSKLSKEHPVFVIKPGETEAGASAMKSHTGALAGENDVFDAALQQAGVHKCDTLEDFFDLTKAFAWEDVPLGPKVAVVSNAGGPAVISADAVIKEGLELVEFNENTKKKLYEVLPRSASVKNPVDVLGDAMAERYGHSAEVILENSDVDALLFILTPQLMTEIEKTAEYISYISKKFRKPVFCSFMGGRLVSIGEHILNGHKIPSFRYPERAISTIGSMWRFKKRQLELAEEKEEAPQISLDQDMGEVRGIIQKAVNEKFKTLDNISADSILQSIGIKTPPTKYVQTDEEAMRFSLEYGWPVVLKLSSQGLLHKMELGGVIGNIINEEQLIDGIYKIKRKTDQFDEEIKKNIQIQIQKQIVGGIEVIVGLKTDPTFGPVVMFGAGGSYVELIDDSNLHLLPMGIPEAKELVKRSRVYSILKGKKDNPDYALDKLYELIVRLSKLVNVAPEAKEVEINPVIVTLNDVWAVDGKVVMKDAIDLPLQPELKPKAKGPQYMTATCLSRDILASKYTHIKFESEKPLIFKPGQYISVKVAEDAIRAYSVATRQDDTHFDLLVDTRPGGPGSMYFENIKQGDKMPYLGPFGVFTFNQDDGAEELVFLATGSGTSAIRCMLDVALQELNYTKPMKLYLGLTFREEIFWKDHYDELAQKYPNFSYDIALFKPDESWEGATGFITELVKKDYPDASKCAAYLCGHRAMIADATDILEGNGCPKERIYTERFI
jgi:acetyl coenzyme A synthetase (ADP forming)-like protein